LEEREDADGESSIGYDRFGGYREYPHRPASGTWATLIQDSIQTEPQICKLTQNRNAQQPNHNQIANRHRSEARDAGCGRTASICDNSYHHECD